MFQDKLKLRLDFVKFAEETDELAITLQRIKTPGTSFIAGSRCGKLFYKILEKTVSWRNEFQKLAMETFQNQDEFRRVKEFFFPSDSTAMNELEKFDMLYKLYCMNDATLETKLQAAGIAPERLALFLANYAPVRASLSEVCQACIHYFILYYPHFVEEGLPYSNLCRHTDLKLENFEVWKAALSSKKMSDELALLTQLDELGVKQGKKTVQLMMLNSLMQDIEEIFKEAVLEERDTLGMSEGDARLLVVGSLMDNLLDMDWDDEVLAKRFRVLTQQCFDHHDHTPPAWYIHLETSVTDVARLHHSDISMTEVADALCKTVDFSTLPVPEAASDAEEVRRSTP